MIQNKVHLIVLGCPRPTITLQCRIGAFNTTIHFISFICCPRWLDVSEDDGLLERTLPLTRVIEGEDRAGEWKVIVTTGNKDNSSTDAQVSLTVFGERGNSGPLPLGVPDSGLFEIGATDEFDVSVHCLVTSRCCLGIFSLFLQ